MAKADTTPCKHGVDIDIEHCWHCLAELYGAGVADDIVVPALQGQHHMHGPTCGCLYQSRA